MENEANVYAEKASKPWSLLESYAGMNEFFLVQWHFELVTVENAGHNNKKQTYGERSLHPFARGEVMVLGLYSPKEEFGFPSSLLNF